jgi:hypothetical protein
MNRCRDPAVNTEKSIIMYLREVCSDHMKYTVGLLNLFRIWPVMGFVLTVMEFLYQLNSYQRIKEI